jgi:O-acetylhomoserine (thiol)-lyase
MNPTTDVLEKRLAALHDGAGAVATSSGQAAIFYSIAAITSSGQNFVTGDKLYGGTYTQFTVPLKRFGIEARFVDSRDSENFRRAIDGDTRLLYTESVGNPKGNVDDLEAIAEVAHRHRLPLIVDNTVTPPPLFNPFEHGADIVVYSLTKMIGGHGTSIGGAVVEKGDFDWQAAGRYPEITEPDLAYHGVNFWEAFGGHEKAVVPGLAYVLKIRTGLLRDLGACLSPFNSWLFIQGLETLPLRARKHAANALEVARFLKEHSQVTFVDYAGLPDHPDFERAKRYFPLGPGAIFGFELKGGLKAGKRFIESVKLASHVANVLDAKTLVIHPASTTHQQLTADEQRKAGVTPGLVRISVGIEDVRDIIADLDQALQKGA